MLCPHCGKKLKNNTVTCPKCNKYCGRNPKQYEENSFHSSNRRPANAGYTQQNTSSRDEFYTGIVHDSSNDSMFFSSKKNAEKNKVFNTNNENHNPDVNPYDTKFYVEPTSNGQIKSEFVASTIAEFGKHRFGRDAANRLRFLFLRLIGTAAVSMFFDIITDNTKITIPITAAYFLITIILYLMTMRTFNPNITLTMFIITFVHILACVIILTLTHIRIKPDNYVFETYGIHYNQNRIKGIDTAVELAFIYIPMLAELILCKMLNRGTKNFLDHWQAYNNQGINVDGVKKNNDIKFYEDSENYTDMTQQ